MPAEPLVLAFDTSAAHCAAALLSGDRSLGCRAEDMGRGQAERLIPMLHEILTEAGCGWGNLDAIGVGVGPGNFTGIRIAVATARGLALGLGIPAYGIDGLAARRSIGPGLASVPAPRDQVYADSDDTDDANAALMHRDAAAARAARLGIPLAPQPEPADLAVAIARLAAARWPRTEPAPAPLYLRAADAAPSRDAPPVLLD